ncbi:MAG: hypothetical protein QME51_09870 [Planctomycetota bacterium]|nr:hypothetical protein [Planctomycetota bacterium]
MLMGIEHILLIGWIIVASIGIGYTLRIQIEKNELRKWLKGKDKDDKL